MGEHDYRTGTRGLYVSNPAAIWVAGNGRRFVNEAADSKEVATAVAALDGMSYWLLFDAAGSRKLNVRDALQAGRAFRRAEILHNPDITVSAASLTELARRTGLPRNPIPAPPNWLIENPLTVRREPIVSKPVDLKKDLLDRFSCCSTCALPSASLEPYRFFTFLCMLYLSIA